MNKPVQQVKDVDWKKAFHDLEFLVRGHGLSEEIEDIVKEATYLRPVPSCCMENKKGENP